MSNRATTFVHNVQAARQKVIDNAARELEARMNAIDKREDKEVGSKTFSTSFAEMGFRS